MQTLTHPLEVASDIFETITVYADAEGSFATTVTINEAGDIAFECYIKGSCRFIDGEPELKREDLEIEILNVDSLEEGELTPGKYTLGQIEKLFETNLQFEIYKKH